MDEHVFPGADASCPMGWVGQPSPENFMVSELIFPVNCHFFWGIPWTNEYEPYEPELRQVWPTAPEENDRKHERTTFTVRNFLAV